jgi:hypothetical protein
MGLTLVSSTYAKNQLLPRIRIRLVGAAARIAVTTFYTMATYMLTDKRLCSLFITLNTIYGLLLYLVASCRHRLTNWLSIGPPNNLIILPF